MTNLNGQSLDILQENISALRQLFPEVCCEDKVDFDKLKQLLGEYVDDSNERYSFTWNGKGKALRLSQTPSMGTLRPCEEESKNWDTTQNMYIEGDNLEVLKQLQKSYHGKIKMIYIDPPYNTGKDFVYPDNFHDSLDNYKRITGQVDDEGYKIGTNTEANGRYHTDWLNMMYPRLRLARNLLSDDGVIFISIDDNEIDNLKKVCGEVFGEDSILAQIIVQNNPRGRQSDTFIATVHEYLICVAKNRNFSILNGAPLNEEQKAEYNLKDEGGQYRLLGLRQRGVASLREDRPDMYFPIYVNPITLEVSLESKSDWAISVPHKSDGRDGRWMWGKQKCIDDNQRLVAKLIASRNEYDIFVKDYLNRQNSERTRKFKSIWLEKNINNQNGTQEVKALLESEVMSFPKSREYLQTITQMGSSENDVILDFFSGSATTAHAVMQLNAEDGGNRKFICVQLPEPCAEGTEAAKAGYKNICEIGKERIRRAGEKIKAEIEEQNAQLKLGEEPKQVPDIGFKVFKLDTSNLKKWQPNYDDLEQSLFDSIGNFVDGRTEQDVVYEIMLKMGLDLTYPLEQHSFAGKNVYSIAFGALMICLDDNITTEVAEGMVSLYKEAAPDVWKIVFKDNGFAADSVKTNIKEILKCAGLEEDAFTTI